MSQINSDIPVGMICPKCGRSWATTFIDPIYEDKTIYKIFVRNPDNQSKDLLKIISKISGKSILNVKKMLDLSLVEIYSGTAVDVKAKISLLKTIVVDYEIIPKFPY